MNRNTVPVLLLGLLLTLGLLAGCAGSEAPQKPEEPQSAQQDSGETSGKQEEEDNAAALGSLASFTAGTLDGGTFTQDDVAAKDVTIVNVWALTCSPCIREMPDLAAYAQTLPDNVQLITVCADGYGREEDAREILEKAGFAGVTLTTGDGDLAALMGNLIYTPTTLFADSEGNLVGDAVVGVQKDLPASYTAAVNRVLAASGKAEISLEDE